MNEQGYRKRDKKRFKQKFKDNSICNRCNGTGQVEFFTTCPECKRFGYLPKRKFK